MASSGNFCTWNPLAQGNKSDIAFSSGNCAVTSGSGQFKSLSNFVIPTNSGKWYVEVCLTTNSGNTSYVGIVSEKSPDLSATGDGFNFGRSSGDKTVYIDTSDGKVYTEGTQNQDLASFTSTNDIIGMVLDMDNDTVQFYGNGSSIGSAQAFPDVGDNYYIWCGGNNDKVCHINAGQDSTFGGAISAGGNADGNGFGDFKYSVPTDAKAITTANLPISDDIDPAQTDTDFPSKQFNVLTYSGNGSTQNITGLGFQPDLCWIKDRTSTAAYGNCLIDSTRGRAKVLYSHDTRAQLTSGTSEDLTSFDSDGFSLANSANAAVNTNGQNYVAWCWKANGGTTTTNTQGAASNTLQANTKAGFSISQFSNSSGATTIGHGLGVAPAFYVIKIADGGGGSWGVYHKSLGATKYVRFNSNAAAATASNYFNDTEPTSTVLSVGSTWTGTTIMCYAWADVEGFQKFGKYIANSVDNDGAPFIYTGFRPRLLAIKGIDTTNSWMVFDTARETANPIDQNLHWDSSAGEATENYRDLDILSNGFKIRTSNGALNDPSGDEYIYCAWGDVPFKYNNTF